MTSKCAKTLHHFNRVFFQILFRYAQFLGILACTVDQQNLRAHTLTRKYKFSLRLFKILVPFVAWYTNIKVYKHFIEETDKSILEDIVEMQIAVISMLSVCSFVIYMCSETQLVQLLNKFFELLQEMQRKTRYVNIFSKNLFLLFYIKMLTTIVRYVEQLPALLQSPKDSSLMDFLVSTLGIWMWIGNVHILDGCFLGFIIIAILYQDMGEHLENLLNQIKVLDPFYKDLVIDVKVFKKPPSAPLSSYKKMLLFGNYAEHINQIDVIYSQLYSTPLTQHILFVLFSLLPYLCTYA